MTGKKNLDRLIKEIADFDIDAAYSLYVNNALLNDSDDLDEAISKLGIRILPESKSKWCEIKRELEERRKKYHKHRDLMIQLANDKTTNIQFLNSYGFWEDTGNATYNNVAFYGDKQYRIHPPVRYLCYRLYFDSNNIMKVWNNKRIDPADLLEWYGDWVETDIILNNKGEINE